MENLELDVGGTKFKGVWIAILFSFASTIGGGIWTASEFFNRLAAQEQAVEDAATAQDKVTQDFQQALARINDFSTSLANVNQRLDDNNVAGLQGKLATLGTNLEQIMKRQGELLDLRDKVAEIEKLSSEQSIKIESKIEKLSQYDEEMKRLKREIDDLWNGMDALSNPLS
jgi:chromosome segregation ATPase